MDFCSACSPPPLLPRLGDPNPAHLHLRPPLPQLCYSPASSFGEGWMGCRGPGSGLGALTHPIPPADTATSASLRATRAGVWSSGPQATPFLPSGPMDGSQGGTLAPLPRTEISKPSCWSQCCGQMNHRPGGRDETRWETCPACPQPSLFSCTRHGIISWQPPSDYRRAPGDPRSQRSQDQLLLSPSLLGLWL